MAGMLDKAAAEWRLTLCVSLILVACNAALFGADNPESTWKSFRGPSGQGDAMDADIPT